MHVHYFCRWTTYDTCSCCIVRVEGGMGEVRAERSTVRGARFGLRVGCLFSVGVGIGRRVRFGF